MKRKHGKQGRKSSDKPLPPSIMNSYPSEISVDSDLVTELSAPSEDGERHAKRWMNLNTK
jgi:hypothetical protein